jgi:hypothetical protein
MYVADACSNFDLVLAHLRSNEESMTEKFVRVRRNAGIWLREWIHPTGPHPWRWRFFQVWVVVFTIVVIWLIRDNNHLGQQNKARISDIQVSRVASCRTTYESFREVFSPFFPPPGKRSPKQARDLKKFNNIIDRKKRKCIRQVQPPSVDTSRITNGRDSVANNS